MVPLCSKLQYLPLIPSSCLLETDTRPSRGRRSRMPTRISTPTRWGEAGLFKALGTYATGGAATIFQQANHSVPSNRLGSIRFHPTLRRSAQSIDMAAAPAPAGHSPSAAAVALPFLVHDVGPEYYEPQSQYNIAGQSLVNTTIDLLQDHRCFDTPQGWVLALHPSSLRAFLWRPEDGDRIVLPDMEQDFPPSCKCVLSGSPRGGGAASCAVMVLDLDKFEYWLCFVGGSSKWERHVYALTMYDADDQPVERHMARHHGIAAVGGKLGFLEFDTADPDEPKFWLIEVDMVDIPDSMPVWWSYLVESCGELFLAVVFFDGENVHKVVENFVHVIDLDKGTQEVRRPFGDFVDPLRPPFWMLPTEDVDGNTTLLLNTPEA
nr:unnamed protein product [Digitaria exilis]